jgi:hypothetical protein
MKTKRECWLLFTECFGCRMYATGRIAEGEQFSDRLDEAARFDERDSKETKVKGFNAIYAFLHPNGANFQTEAV